MLLFLCKWGYIKGRLKSSVGSNTASWRRAAIATRFLRALSHCQRPGIGGKAPLVLAVLYCLFSGTFNPTCAWIKASRSFRSAAHWSCLQDFLWRSARERPRVKALCLLHWNSRWGFFQALLKRGLNVLKVRSITKPLYEVKSLVGSP